MPELKLGKLPDRTPAKITITVPPDLHRALQEYAGAYRATYGEAETIPELIPFMLLSFLASDRGFAKAQKGGLSDLIEYGPNAGTRRGRRASRVQPQSASEEPR